MFKTWLENNQLPSVQGLQRLLPQLAQAAQQVYNAWSQNDDGWDEEYGGGGICHDIANAMCEVLYNNSIECTSFSAQIGEQHVWVIAKFAEGVYSIDIPPSVYETGGGYTWKKTYGVTIEPTDITIDMITPDPNEFDQYEEY